MSTDKHNLSMNTDTPICTTTSSSSSTTSTTDASTTSTTDATTTTSTSTTTTTTTDADADASTADAVQNGVSCVDALVDSFYNHVIDLLNAMIEVWPECKGLRKKKLEFDLTCTHSPDVMRIANRNKLIVGYHAIMHPHYTRCSKRDESIMTDTAFHTTVPLLNGIEFDRKWTEDDIDDETKEHMWGYITNLNRFANMHNLYAKVPTNMMKNIETMATSIHSSIEAGDTTMNIESISDRVMKDLNQDDLKSFAKHMSTNMTDITSVCSMLGDMFKQTGIK
jgi:hypothetical protein